MRLGNLWRVRLIPIAALAAILFILPVSAQEATPSPDAGFPSFSALQPLPDAAARDGGPLKVVASTPIIADFVRQVGGQRVQA
jgi:ABC-type Zn uptake system ZnuABC Zn-binding protein ZnuA